MTRTELLEIEMTCATLRSAADKLQRAAKLMAASTALATAEAALARLAPVPPAAPPAAQREAALRPPRAEIAKPAESRVSRVATVTSRSRRLAVFDVDGVEGTYRSRACEVDFSALRSDSGDA